MKKKVLMSLVLLAIIGTSAVFAQAPTMDKLKMSTLSAINGYRAAPLNKDISGTVVFPATYEGLPVAIDSFIGYNKITSLVIPAGVKWYSGGFYNCTALTSVTFEGSDFTGTKGEKISGTVFDGDLCAKYNDGGAGTYTREAGGKTWTKVGGFSLSGTWTRADGMKITITDNGANIVITGDKPNNGGKLNDTYTKK
ncbi:MAG: hypothetical protein LBC76_12070 [Treponema sp.]|jgi:hypothetical protein|nr:hypothetical protein [Treponema sp.]